MASISEDPVRLDKTRPYKRSALPVLREVLLPSPLPVSCSFELAVGRRRSAELFGPITAPEMGTWLRFTAGLQATNMDDSNRQRRFVGSFGALHPAHILIGTPTNVWSVYLPGRHALGVLDVDQHAAALVRKNAEDCHPGCGAFLIALLADLDLAESYYGNPLQLLLRDGGVLLGHASLVAAAIDLTFRILGNTGGNVVSSLILGVPFRSVGTGLAWLGGAKTEPLPKETSQLDQIDLLLSGG